MNRLVLVAYVLLIGWSIGALGWIGQEMGEQHRIRSGLIQLREGSAPEAEKHLLSLIPDSPLYFVQELQQEPGRDLKIRIATGLEKAVGKIPQPLDTGNVFSVLSSEKIAFEELVENQLNELETPWLTGPLRARLKSFHDTSQTLLTQEEKKQIQSKAEEALQTLWTDLPNRERKIIHDHVVQFIANRWSDLGPERLDRLCEFLSSFIHLRYGGGAREEKDRFIELMLRQVRTRGEDLSAAEKEWFVERLQQFLDRLLPAEEWKPAVLQIARVYGLEGWSPLTEEERILFEQSKNLRKKYSEQRERFARLLQGAIEVMASQNQDVDRVLLTEMVSLLGDPDETVARIVADSLLVLARKRIHNLALGIVDYVRSQAQPAGDGVAKNPKAAEAEEKLKVAGQPLADMLILLRKTLYRETVPSVMAVQTREKSKEERKQELERLARGARVRCARVLGQIAVEGKKEAATISEEGGRSLFHERVTGHCQKVLGGILGSPQAGVVDAAQQALRATESPMDANKR